MPNRQCLTDNKPIEVISTKFRSRYFGTFSFANNRTSSTRTSTYNRIMATTTLTSREQVRSARKPDNFIYDNINIHKDTSTRTKPLNQHFNCHNNYNSTGLTLSVWQNVLLIIGNFIKKTFPCQGCVFSIPVPFFSVKSDLSK